MCLISLNNPAAQSVKNQRTFAVIRFKRDTKFPRFAVSAGERWSFLAVNKTQERLDQIKRGERFEFAGGLCDAQDVEIIYEGPCGLSYALAAGHLKAELTDAVAKRMAAASRQTI